VPDARCAACMGRARLRREPVVHAVPRIPHPDRQYEAGATYRPISLTRTPTLNASQPFVPIVEVAARGRFAVPMLKEKELVGTIVIYARGSPFQQ